VPELRPDTAEVEAERPARPPRDLLLTAAIEELRRRTDELEEAHAAREAELETAVAERTAELAAAHRAAAREHERLLDLVERLQDGILAIDARLEIVFSNATARQLLPAAGVPAGLPLPDPWPELPLRDLARRLFQPGAEVEEARVVTPRHTIRVTGLPARGAGSAILVLADLSERERREQAEREFVVNAAHELRTPLAAILTAVEVLQGAQDDPVLREQFMGHLERQSARLGRLAEALLVLARAQMGVEAPRREIVAARPLLEQAAAELRPATGVRVEVECANGLAIFGHAELLEQAISNLASNAAKHTARGTITLRCRAETDSWVALEVVDTGTGISPEDQARVAERFVRVGGEPGFGLGLAIATQAAKALSGRLEIESARGRGTTARLVLPAAELVAGG
jgi:two-component system phosphate regulon sensor histidine kinase PhoR